MENKTVELLKKKIEYIDELLKSLDNNSLRQWREETLMILDNLIAEGSKYYINFEKIRYTSSVGSFNDPIGNRQRNQEALIRGLNEAKSSLNAVIYGVENGLIG